MRPPVPRRSVTAFPSTLARIRTFQAPTPIRDRVAEEFRRRLGCPAIRFTASGREGLQILARLARDLGRTRAYVPTLTIDAVPEILRRCGFEVIPLDIDPDTLSLTPDLLRRACRGPGIALVTHYFGLPAEMPALRSVAEDLGIDLLEDCAHAPLATVEGQPVGTFGIGGFFSFESRKPLNAMGGGLMFTRDPRIAASLATLALPPPSRWQDARKLAYTAAEALAWSRPGFRWIAPWLHREQGRRLFVGIYRRMHASSRAPTAGFSDLQAALLEPQIAAFDDQVRRKAALARRYRQGLPASWVLPLDPPDRPHLWYMFVVRHPQARDLGRFLRREGIDCGIGPEVLPLCGDGAATPGAREVVQTALELPMHDALREEDVDRVCEVAARFQGSRGPSTR